jgi:hypothetical protein
MQAYSVLVFKQYLTAIVNRNKHLSWYYNVPASAWRQIVDCFGWLNVLDPAEVKLLDEPAEAKKSLENRWLGYNAGHASLLPSAKIRYVCTVKRIISRLGGALATQLYGTVKMQGFFRTGWLQKYFRIR